MIKRYVIKLTEMALSKTLPPLLNAYERWVMYRVRDAWGLAHLAKIKQRGVNVKLVGYSRYLDPDGLLLGDNVRIGYGCFFFCKGGIQIGSNTIISRDVTIYSANHDYKEDYVPFGPGYVKSPVIVGKHVWIGMGVKILPGVKIGDGAIIGMGAIVARDVFPGEIVVGQPIRTVGTQDTTRQEDLARAGKIFSACFKDS